MQAIKNVYKRMSGFVGKLRVQVVKRSAVALPRDEHERLEALQALYKALTILLVLTVLCTGVWLSDHGYPSWVAVMLFALRLLYALPAKRVERALRQHQYHDREKARAQYSDPGQRRAKSA